MQGKVLRRVLLPHSSSAPGYKPLLESKGIVQKAAFSAGCP